MNQVPFMFELAQIIVFLSVSEMYKNLVIKCNKTSLIQITCEKVNRSKW